VRKALQPTTNGNGALQNIFNKGVLAFVKILENTPASAIVRYDYTAVTGISATISYINTDRHIVGCRNVAETTITIPTDKMEITIKDEALDPSSADLIINPPALYTIEGESSLTVVRSGDSKGISITLYKNDSTGWFIK